MKHHLYTYLAILLCSFLQSSTNVQLTDCKCKNIELKGRVKVVASNADFKVKVVDSFPDLRVKRVKSFPIHCGEWQFVDTGEDFTIQFVSNFPDFTIMYVEQFPGVK